MQVDTGSGLTGAAVLAEATGDVGLLLWLNLRAVLLWAETPAEAREGLFNRQGARKRLAIAARPGLVPEVEVASAVIAGMVARPVEAHEAVVSAACHSISTWSLRTGLPQTALSFAFAAAAARPGAAEPAVQAGRLALQLGRIQMAEVWLHRALALARTASQRSSYSSALLELGRVAMARGNSVAARREFLRAGRAARRFSQPETRGLAALGLADLAVAAGDHATGARYARLALRPLGPDRPEGWTARLLLAEAWLGGGDARRAAPVLKGLMKSAARDADRLRVGGLLARAAVRLDDAHLLDRSWAWATRSATRVEASPAKVHALLELASAAAEAGESARARSAARHALAAAEALGDAVLTARVRAFIPA